MVLSCNADDLSQPAEPTDTRTKSSALTALQARVLGFESPETDWSSSVGTIHSTAEATQGDLALAVTPTGWTELNSVPLDTLGAVKDELTYDLYVPSGVSWGETRAILVAPSLGLYWLELGRKELSGLPGGEYSEIQFALPAAVRTQLSEGTFDDLQIKLVLNAPALPEPYRLDNLAMTEDEEVSAEGGSALFEFSLPMPDGVQADDVFVSVSDHLSVYSQAVLGREGTLPVVANLGTYTTYLQAEAKVNGSIVSRAPVQLDAKAFVGGSIVSEGVIGKQGVDPITGVPLTGDAPIVEGDETEHGSVPYSSVAWRVEWPDESEGPVELSAVPMSDAPHVVHLEPGAYGHVNIHDRNHLYLESGTYYFRSFNTEPEAELHISAEGGPVVVYVRDARFGGLNSKAPVVLDSGNAGDFFLGYLGDGRVFAQGRFKGTIAAPQATIELARPNSGYHAGSFFAAGLEIAAGTHEVRHVATNWTGVLPPPVFEWQEAPVLLQACLNEDGTTQVASKTFSVPVRFVVPERIPASSGSAANGVLELRFDGDGGEVTCTYRGQSTVPEPRVDDSRVEWAKGLSYQFQGCDGDYSPGDVVAATEFELEVFSGDPMGLAVCGEVHLGDGCSAPLEPAIDPVLAAEVVDGFDWTETEALPEIDPDGHPAFHYAWIYVENQAQIRGLNKMKVHWDINPVFSQDYEKWAGKCGRLSHDGDHYGVFVHAVIPAALYNYLRAETLARLADGRPMPFRAIHFPGAPELLANPDGSLSWEALREHRFQYDSGPRGGLEEQLPWGLGDVWDAVKDVTEDAVELTVEVGEVVGDVIVEGASYLGEIDELWENGSAAVVALGTALTDFVGEVDKFLFGRVVLTLDFTLLNRDPAFPAGPALRARGDRKGTRLVPEGSTVYVKQWSGIFPSSYNASLPPDGRVGIEVGKGNTARGESGVCLELENRYGIVSSLVLAEEVCDFRDLALQFRQDWTSPANTDDYRVNILAQATESGQLLEVAADHEPYQVEVSTGWVANQVTTASNGRIFAPCLDFPSAQSNLIQLLGIAGGGGLGSGALATTPIFASLALIGASALQKDVFYPTSGEANHSRGLPTHEYGHFAMCSFLFEESGASGLNKIINRLFEGDDDSRDDVMTLFFESFADLFALKTVGGANYINEQPVQGGFYSSPAMVYCDGLPCTEVNWKGHGGFSELRTGDEFTLELGRTLTTFVDVFDGLGRWHQALPGLSEAGNADVWVPLPDPASPGVLLLNPAPGPYLAPGPGGTDDENVALELSRLRNWLGHWDELFDVPSGETGVHMRALALTMEDAGENWCDICDVYAQHSPGYTDSGAPPRQERFRRMEHCEADAQLQTWMPPPPNGLKLDSMSCLWCPPGAVSIGGMCFFCPAGQVPAPDGGNSCVACGAGTQPNAAATECESCPPGQVSTGLVCEPCDAGTWPNAAQTACLTCPVDQVLDYSPVDDAPCVREGLLSTVPDPGDTCPQVLVVDITNLAPDPGERAWVWVEPELSVSESECTGARLSISVADPAGAVALTGEHGVGATAWVDPGCPDELVCEEPTCEGIARLNIPEPVMTVLGHTIRVAVAMEGSDGTALPAWLGVSQDDEAEDYTADECSGILK